MPKMQYLNSPLPPCLAELVDLPSHSAFKVIDFSTAHTKMLLQGKYCMHWVDNHIKGRKEPVAVSSVRI